VIHICANGHDRAWVDETVREYRLRVQEFVVRDQGIDEVREG
jgi:mannose-1-phosphate guanylyltransferase / phosphomannomutase